MNITFVLPVAAIHPVGGIKVVYEYANHLVCRGHSVTIVHPAILQIDTPWSDLPKKMVRYVQRVVDKSYIPKNWFNMDKRVKMQWVLSLKETNIPDADVVIATAWQTAEWVQSYGPMKGVKYYLIQDYEHYMTVDSETRERIAATYNSEMHNIVISAACHDMVKGCGAEVEAYVPNGIDFETYKLKTDFGSTERRAIGFPSRPEKFKGTRDAVAALDDVRKKLGDNITAWSFGGRKPDYFPSWISYYERPSDDLLCDLYNSSAIFVTASHYEGWGLPGAEAMSCGAALASTEHGGVRAYAEHGQTALLSAPKDIDALAGNICRLLESPNLRQIIAQAGYQHIQQFSWEKATDSLEAALSHEGK
ncbi:glycosyltransferase family 4 protein [Acidithiobacillus concretivorus]|uniref:Glycosyltransferase family 4 protein n=1 Tax=Acidithiobacillus concretivorus TaxID=3063952 RepID=A0ABS5ZKJ3_9PROT|nr:glycosyltransferase family 4 protein [Acidithiobacillus concretivorus]MBU2737241.1 glycosyltransferase family 4 protein [Acidithiobacillus concretivorus]